MTVISLVLSGEQRFGDAYPFERLPNKTIANNVKLFHHIQLLQEVFSPKNIVTGKVLQPFQKT